MKILTIILGIMLSACSTTQENNSSSLIGKPLASALSEGNTTESKNIYYFQHRVLPNWTFSTQGEFYNDLAKGDLSELKSAAEEIVSPDYASNIVTQYYEKYQAVLIVFPIPTSFTNCFYILIQKNNNNFNFYTYEKTLSFGENDPVKGVVGMWTEDKLHGNLGGRTYTSSDSFVNDLLK